MKYAALIIAILFALVGCGSGEVYTPPPGGTIVPAPDPTPFPSGIEIPTIDVESPLGKTTVDNNNRLIVSPLSDPKRIDWYEKGGLPGDKGFPAVIISHVDGGGQSGGFARLHELVPGDNIYINRADGSKLGYLVSSVHVYDKAKFPTAEVYRPSDEVSKLVLITCGGPFVGGETGYRDNIVVYATLDEAPAR